MCYLSKLGASRFRYYTLILSFNMITNTLIHLHSVIYFDQTMYSVKYWTDCHRKNRYVQICYHSRINRATSLKCSGPVHHPMECLYLKWYRFYSSFYNIPLFSAYQPWSKKCFLTPLNSILRNGYGITNNCPRPPHDKLFYG